VLRAQVKALVRGIMASRSLAQRHRRCGHPEPFTPAEAKCQAVGHFEKLPADL
jgi:hypothetical protein